jgi:sugar phosphate isomerase/epimerase
MSKYKNKIILCDDDRIEKISKLSLKNNCGIEIQSFYDPSYILTNPDAIEAHIGLIKDINLRSLHGPFGDLCPGSYDPMIRDVARNRFELAHEIANKLNATHIILHHGYVPHTSQPINWIKRCSSFWREFIKNKNNGIKFHIENHLDFDPYIIHDVIDEINNNNVNICLDIGHVHCCSKTSVIDWIRYLNNKIGYVHLHNNYGTKDEHLGFQKGTIPMEEVLLCLLELSPNAIWAIESKVSEINDSLNWLKEKNFIN